MGQSNEWERISDHKIKCSIGIWRSIDTELLLLGLGLSGKTCPISLIIDKAIANTGYSDFAKIVEIEFFEKKQADLVERVYDQRISKLQDL